MIYIDPGSGLLIVQSAAATIAFVAWWLRKQIRRAAQLIAKPFLSALNAARSRRKAR